MENLNFIKNVDVYLLDQCMKGRVNSSIKVLDAGFGKGRNFRFLKQQNIDVIGIDPNSEYVELLQKEFLEDKSRIVHSSIEGYNPKYNFDFIVCNAVLHFAKNHAHFNEMFSKLVSFLTPKGILFIRMTSNIGLESFEKQEENGVYKIPDGSIRYLIERQKIDDLLEKFQMFLIEPVKTVNVDGLRCMTTLVLSKRKV